MNKTVEQLIGNRSNGFQRGIHRGGFGAVVPPAPYLEFDINIDNDGFQRVRLRPFDPGDTLADVSIEMELAIQTLIPLKTQTSFVAFACFTCSVESAGKESRLVLESGTNTSMGTESPGSSVQVRDAPVNNAAGYLKLGESNKGQSEDALGLEPPGNDDLIESLIAGLHWEPAPGKRERKRRRVKVGYGYC
ncbi:MAG: hypothetical protein GY940_14885 [bacterium]|nr:hypothetical protein [bacterium]